MIELLKLVPIIEAKPKLQSFNSQAEKFVFRIVE